MIGLNGRTNGTRTSRTNRARRRGNTLVAGLVFVVALVALLAVLGNRFAGSSEAPVALTPAGGAPATLDEAIALSAERGVPVVAIATAVWCPPCQQYKGSTLAEASVQEMLTTEAVTVMIDVDQNNADAQRLGVRGIPATYVIRDGEVVASQTGALSRSALSSLVRSGTATN